MDNAPIVASFPTTIPEITAIVRELQSSILAILGDQLVGLYLEGSLAAGGFDAASDIDFIAVMEDDITPDLFASLQAMHDRLKALDNPWAIRIEGMYSSRADWRRYDPTHVAFPNIERGRGERLRMVHYDETGVIHRWILRQYGIVLLGPPPQTLTNPVTPDDLRELCSPSIVLYWQTDEMVTLHFVSVRDG